jgi:hypothetical protein
LAVVALVPEVPDVPGVPDVTVAGSTLDGTVQFVSGYLHC